MAKHAINGWFSDLVGSAARPIFNLLHTSVLGTPPLDSPDMFRAREMWGVSRTIADTCYVLVITIAGVMLMAGQSLPVAEVTPGQLITRLVMAFLASNLSLTVIGQVIDLANGLAGAFLSQGGKAVDPSVVADLIAGYVASAVNPWQPFLAILALAIVIMALAVVAIYIARVAITMILIGLAPIALIFHALPATDGLARLWWRGFTGILAIQVCQSLTLAALFRLLFTETKTTSGHLFGLPTASDIVDLLLAFCLLYVMVRIPSWVAKTIWQAGKPRVVSTLLRTLLIYRWLRLLTRKAVPTPAPKSRRPPPARGTRPPPAAGPRPGSGPGLGPGGGTPPRLPSGPSRRLALPGPPHAPGGPGGPIPLSGPLPLPGPTPLPPAGGSAAKTGSVQGRPAVQLSLPIPARPPVSGEGKQLALPVPVTRIARPPAAGGSADAFQRRSGRTAGRQLMLPGTRRTPAGRQQPLWIEPPNNRRRRGR